MRDNRVNRNLDFASAFAPATVANVAVGFDIMGFALDVVGDVIKVTRSPKAIVTIESISANPLCGDMKLPADPKMNTATVGLMKLIKDLKLTYGFNVSIRKGIPLGSGMGGSAASSVAALVAANALLKNKLPKVKLLEYAMLGEKAASGTAHPDNAAPCLFGGITFIQRNTNALKVTPIPTPKNLKCVLIHPKMRLDTKKSRKVLKSKITLADYVTQSANLAGFMAGCFNNNLELISHSLTDVIIEPQRAMLIPGFYAVKNAALQKGALGCSISGSGPSVFALVDSQAKAIAVQKAMVRAFNHVNLQCDSWISNISQRGARLL